jgi:GT2 family glycosyltransferase
MTLQVAIGVVSYERAEVTRRCIESIASCTPAGRYHLYLVDNGSHSADAEKLLQWCQPQPEITVQVLDTNYGPAHARNCILQMIGTSADVIIFLDNDITALEGWLQAGLAALEAGADLVQPKLLQRDGRTVERGPTRVRADSLAANPEYLGIGLDTDDPLVNVAGGAAIVGGTCVVRRLVFELIGGYDVQLHIGEDFDLCYRARAAGLRLRYAPECALIHDHGFDLAYDQERGRLEKYLTAHVVFWRKHQKALLSPRYLHWYAWLQAHGEPMYMPLTQRWRTVARRLRRRWVRRWCMMRYPNHWRSLDRAEAATQTLAQRLGM